MQILSATGTSAQPDYVALAMILALILAIAVLAIRKKIALNNAAKQPVPETAPVQASEKALAPGVAGELKLHDVEPKTAAMLMAIVADKLGKPLNELRFISIKEVK